MSSLVALGRRPGVELPLSVLATLFFLAVTVKLGTVMAVFALLLVGAVVVGLASPTAYAVLVLALAPLPALGSLVGERIPLGLDPLDVLVVIGVGVAAQQSERIAFMWSRRFMLLIFLNLGLLFIAWYRTYGQETLSGSSLALILKPLVVILAAAAVVQLLPREGLSRVLGSAMGVALIVVGASIVLQRLGVYETAHQVAYEESLGAKQYGGLMLDGNSAGSLFGLFGVPVFALLRASGRLFFARAVLFLCIPILFISLSRSGIVAFTVGLLMLAAFDRGSLRGLRTAGAVFAVAAIWALTLGRSQLLALVATISGHASDRNASLSGRGAIWAEAHNFLGLGNHWLFGGGLDSFRDFALTGRLHHAFATHNLALRLLTNGGLVMAAGFVVLIFALWRIGKRSDQATGLALRIALVSMLALGVTLDFDIFSRLATWIWVLAAAAAVQAPERDDSAAATNRSAIAPTSHGRSGARIASRASAAP